MSRPPLLIEVVAQPTTAAAVLAYQQADPRSDLVEIRLDAIADLRLDRILAARGRPKLLTARSRGQGGALASDDRRALLGRLAGAPAEWIDLEVSDLETGLPRKSPGPKRLLSWHDLNGTPLDLAERLGTLLAAPDIDLVKVVTFAEVAGDNLRLRDLLRSAPRDRVVAFAMGARGMPSRILAGRWGSAAIYAPRRGAPASAPGQVTIEDLEEVYRWREIGPSTALFGVLGAPVGGSLSPVIHNAAFAALGLDLRYLPFEAASIAEFLPLFSELRLKGLSVTHPFKEAMLAHLEVVAREARRCAAVNTVVKVWNRLEGHNTDLAAVLVPLRGWLPLRGARVAVLGAGGAARALVEGLVGEGSRVVIFNRTADRARALARAAGVEHRPLGRLKSFACDLVVNATPVGMMGGGVATPVPVSWLRAPRLYDLVYNPRRTLLMQRARARGIDVRGGLEMFLAQGAAQFQLFTGRPAPLEVMRQAVDAALGRLEAAAERSAPPPAPRRAAAGRRIAAGGRGGMRAAHGSRKGGRHARR